MALHDGNQSRNHLLLQQGAQRGSARPSLLEYPKSTTMSHQVLPLPAPNGSRNVPSELVSSFLASVLQEPRDATSSDTAPGRCSPAAEETPATNKNHRTQDDSYQTHQLVLSIALPGSQQMEHGQAHTIPQMGIPATQPSCRRDEECSY